VANKNYIDTEAEERTAEEWAAEERAAKERASNKRAEEIAQEGETWTKKYGKLGKNQRPKQRSLGSPGKRSLEKHPGSPGKDWTREAKEAKKCEEIKAEAAYKVAKAIAIRKENGASCFKANCSCCPSTG